MKHITMIAAVCWTLLLTPGDRHEAQGAGKDSPEPNSSITSVVVYPNHAQVTREITLETNPGEQQVVFTGLVSILNPQNLRATGSEGIRITGTETKTVFLKESRTEEIKTLDQSIQELGDQLAAGNKALQRWFEERNFYTAIKTRLSGDLSKEIAENRLSVGDWREMLGFVREGLAACDEAVGSLEIEIRDLQRELEVLNQKRSRYLERRPKEMKEVTVSFTANGTGQQAVCIHYIVPSARWEPVYDVHLDRATKAVEVIGYGHVTQWTGENWDQVNLALAMSRPDFELSLPTLKPVVVSFDAETMQQLARDISILNEAPQAEAQEWTKQRFKAPQEFTNFRRNLEQLSRESDDKLGAYGLNRKLIQKALSRLVDRFAGVRYDVDRTETIPCDGSPHKVVVFSASVPVDLKHVATPALGDTVVLKGESRNATGHPILEGDISLFIDNSYVGASKVTSAAQNEGISFCFGPDDSLVVKRELVEKKIKGPENFRQSQVITYRYRITVENFNDRVASVEVADQIPTSKTADIQVKFLESNLPHNLDEPTGQLSWNIEVAPGKREEITFSFSIECPVGRTIYWK